ncbi:MAG: hypothetical protein AB1755_05795 [Candidatus Omnitrophota bacterium]
MTYLFIGEDELSKRKKLELIKKENLDTSLDKLNFQTVFAKELTCVELQEYLHKYPFKDKKIIFVIKEVEHLSQDSKKFLLEYIKNPSAHILLILDIYNFDIKDDFINKLVNCSQIKVFTFKRGFYPSVFSLGRLIDQKKTQEALCLLNELMLQRTQAQKIIGALRYQWEKENLNLQDRLRRFNLLLETDLAIKTGRLTETVALEVFLIKLCTF